MIEPGLESKSESTLLVWDAEGPPPVGDWTTVLWSSFGKTNNPSVISIPTLVEEQADTLRARYLAWIYELGEARINCKRLVDRLELRPGFSYWWMTLLAGKCNYAKSPQIYDALRLFAFEDIISVYSPSKIILTSSDKTLSRVFRVWCSNASLAFEWRRLKEETTPVSPGRKLYRLLPQPVQAAATLLRYLRQRWPLSRVGTAALEKSKGKVTFCSYLFNLDKNAAELGRFYTSYWTDLHSVLEQEYSSVNWLQLFIEHETVPTAQKARDLIVSFNESGADTQLHTTLDAALGLMVIKGVLLDYGRIVLTGLRLGKIRHHFRPANSRVDLWPLFEQDWRKSLFGTAALSNCLFLNLFEYTLKHLPRQELGIYLLENQPWEMAFTYAWKAAGHGKVVGVPHSTLRYWDLRYFYDSRSYQRTGKNDLLLPDVIALNGPAAIAAYRKGGGTEERIVEVEALRYLYLTDFPPIQNVDRDLSNGSLRVLVLGDYLPSNTRQLMQWLHKAATSLPEDTRYIVKPHPNCPIKASDYPGLQLRITGSPLAELLSDCDVAYTSNITSAAVDAYCAGVSVVSVLGGEALNMSPLRGLSRVAYVSGPSELAHALLHASESKGMKPEAYFCLDKKLPRWRHLLGMGEPETV